MSTRALILGCSGPVLTRPERDFFREVRPWGYIVFKRNIETPDQLRRLCDDLRACVGRADAPILVDQEGGRVQRLGPPHWPAYPTARAFTRMSADPAERRRLVGLGARLIARDLLAVGLNVDCLPVLDVPVPGAHDVIGERAYGLDADIVADLGRAAAEALLAEGVLPVVKHIPGHGRAEADSHHDLPVVTASREALEAQDFAPFRALRDMPLAMTAHVVYTAIDPDAPASTSRKVMDEVVRGHIGYDGLVMSDDLSMNALSGTIGARARAVFAAGADVALHCNGERAEMEAAAVEAPILSGDAARRAEAALARLRPASSAFDPVEARAELEAALALAS